MKVIATPTENLPTELFDDFVVHLENRYYDEIKIRLACFRLGQLKNWGLILPRKFLVNITDEYEMEEMEDRPDIYIKHDAVMVKKKLKVLQ